MRPVLLLEINEVPLRVYKKYAADPRFPNVRKLVEESDLIDTFNSDSGELSPWCTWPTFHRGLSKVEHGIAHLGQDPGTYRGTPIWDEYLRQGKNVGIFGSLQSWPPRDPGTGGFYVPDTFSPTSECKPGWIEPIQELNLSLVRENGRMMSDSLAGRVLNPRLLTSLFKAGIRPSTLVRSAMQLIRERFNPASRQRRVTFQALLFWDIFRKLYSPEHPPAFSTFFTNHVASVEHRFWNHVFPEDFDGVDQPETRFHLPTMDFAMQILDEFLGEAFAWRRRNPDILLIIANSMGQGARVARKHHGYELMVRDVPRLFSQLGIPAGIKQNLAMAPQLAFDVGALISPERFMEALGTLTCKSGRKIFLCENRNRTVTVTVDTPPAREIEGNRVLAAGRELTLSEVGIERVTIEPGTAYHIPEGLIFVHGLKREKLPAQQPVPAENVKDMILSWAEFEGAIPNDSAEKNPAAHA